MVEVGREDGREGKRADDARAVSYEAFVHPLKSVDRFWDSARRREVERPLRKDDADCSDLASCHSISERRGPYRRQSLLTHIEDVNSAASALGLHNTDILGFGYLRRVHTVFQTVLVRAIFRQR